MIGLTRSLKPNSKNIKAKIQKDKLKSIQW